MRKGEGKNIDFIRNGVYNLWRLFYCAMYVVNQEKCTGCGTCIDVCPTDAIRIRDGKAVIDMACVDCGACPRVCPEGAIRKQPTGAPAALGAAKD